MRELILGGLLALAAVLVVIGVAILSVAAAWIVGGLCLAGFACLVFGEVG